MLSNGVLHWHTAIRHSKSTNIVFHTYVHSGRAKKIQNGSDSGQRPLQSWVLYWHTAINVMSMCCSHFCVVWRKKREDETNYFTPSDPHRDIILYHIMTYLSQILSFFVLKSGEDGNERIILIKSTTLRSLSELSSPRPFSWLEVQQ